ncbi:dihydrolipoamide acetyltransferase family protein [Halorubrum sp. DTA98]|uniref:dihydrolipoamide acetyltransferase family protein n=1 Tax=Halorubrum sp. DTA98 TaxID=3402163 RepID=UPI003AAEAC68
MTVKEFKLPDVGEGVAEGELVTWLVAPGDRVEEDQPVAEVETDKALVEVPSRYDGVVEELFAEEGEIVPVGTVIISFRVDEGEDAPATADGSDEDSGPADAEPDATDDGSEPSDAEPADAEPAGTDASEPEPTTGRTFAPPSTRRLARELGVDIDAVSGAGSGGRVSEADVRAAAERGGDESDLSSSDGSPGPKPVDVGSGDRTSAVSTRDEAVAETATTAEAAGRETTLATPATRTLARDLDVDIDDVPTDESREGEAFVTEAHVREYAEAGADAAPDATTAPDADATTAPDADAGVDAESADPSDASPETIPYRGVRRTIGKQMERSKYTAPHVTHHDTAEVDELVAAREELKPKAEAAGVKLTYMPFVMKAIVAGLKEYPVLNSELREDDEEIRLKTEYNIGIAVATDAGLMVPVVDDVDEKGVFELAAAVNDLASRARDRTLKPDEMKGGTFTITNFGAIGGEYATPIINYPETAILGLGAIEERPVVRTESDVGGFLDDGEGTTVVPAPTLPLSLSIDHRVVDGAVAAAFANTVMDHLETPLLLLNE